MHLNDTLRRLFTTALVIECTIALLTAACIGFALMKAFWTTGIDTTRKVAEAVSTDVAPAVVDWAESHAPGVPEPLMVLEPAAATPANPFVDGHTAARLEAKRLEIAIDAARADVQRSSEADAPGRRARLDSLEALRSRQRH